MATALELLRQEMDWLTRQRDDIEAHLWELGLAIYLAYYPDTAQGAQLANAGQLTGQTPISASFSTVTQTLIGTAGTVIPLGSQIGIPGTQNLAILDVLRETNQLSDETVEKLGAEVDKFKLEFQTGEGKQLASVGREKFEAIAQEDVNQEQIVKAKR